MRSNWQSCQLRIGSLLQRERASLTSAANFECDLLFVGEAKMRLKAAPALLCFLGVCFLLPIMKHRGFKLPAGHRQGPRAERCH